MINAIIIEDEQSSMEYLISILKNHHKNIKVLGWASNVGSAVSLIQKTLPEIVFLDIQLNNGTGFQVLDQLQTEMTFEVIFTTGFLDYKAKAMDYFAFYYLNKPIQAPELKKVLDMYELKRSAFDRHKFKAFREQIENKGEVITLFERGEYVTIRLTSILYCEAAGSYSNIYLRSGEILTISKNLKHIEDLIAHNDFFRVHRSYLVNLKLIKKYTDDGIIIMKNNTEIVTSVRSRKKVIQLLRIYHGDTY